MTDNASGTTLLSPVRATFRALAGAIVPEARGLDDGQWRTLESIVEDALSQRPAGVRRQLLTFMKVLNILPVFRWGRTFRRLDPARQERFLAGVQGSGVFLIRRGFWGLRTLVYMGYYARPEAYEGVGYGARLRGWMEHPAAPAEARRVTAAKIEAGP